MKLTESSNTNLLIIDVQPEYDNWCSEVLPGIQQQIEKSNGKVIIVFNDFGGGDSPSEVYQYLAGKSDDDEYYDNDEESALSSKLQQATYMQKEFGFLRGWMDTGVSDAVIIEVIRAMANNRVNDSRELDMESLSEKAQDEVADASDSISMQDWVPVHFLKKISPFYLMGGGRNECLREIELFCNAFNIRYKRIDSLIYG